VSESVVVFLNSVLAQADKAGEAVGNTPGQPTGPGSHVWILFVAFMAFIYLFMMRPQQKREKERREMLASLSKGDEVITNGGIHGTIVGLSEKTVVLRVSDDPAVKMEFARGAVSRVNVKDDKDD